MQHEKANAVPAKEFFISMLTRDISLTDCILDLLDNAVDGAHRNREETEEKRLAGYYVRLRLTSERFAIDDNCGGIPVTEAKEYAFNFGRRRDAPPVADESIGIYGIGMKRALFKLGKEIAIVSSTRQDSFRTEINVEEWEGTQEWQFDLVSDEPQDHAGTRITVGRLNPGVGEELVDPVFQNKLSRAISRGYALFMRNGLEVTLNAKKVHPEYFKLLVGDDFKPVRTSYDDNGVHVEITAGMASPPPKDDSADAEFPHYHKYGWYVVCNDRVVLAGDKSARTVWGNDKFNAWHNQYNGFLGVAAFRSRNNPAGLPWTTTKRDLDLAHPLYRRALSRMKDATKPYIEYTNARKDQEERMAQVERSTQPMLIEEIEIRSRMKVPRVDPQPKITMGNVLYRKPRGELREAASALGDSNMSYKEVGIRTFEYFCEHEIDGG